jgi:plastocyanin domain-containing protein
MMTTLDWIVAGVGIAAIAWVNWYFFLAPRGVQAAVATAAGRQEIVIAVEGGYEPATIRVKAGTPLHIVFDRRETSPCSEEVVFPDFGLKKFLPAHQRTAVDITPSTPGTYEFTCGMGMLHGKVIAE